MADVSDIAKMFTPEVYQALQDPQRRRQAAFALAAQFPPPPEGILDVQGVGQQPTAPVGGPPLRAPQAPKLTGDPFVDIGRGIPNFGGFGAPNILPQGK